MKISVISCLMAAGASLSLFAESPTHEEFAWEDYYDIVSIPGPDQVDLQIGGLDLTASGEVAACFHRGEVMIYNPESGQWRVFASGLHEPLGICVEKEGTILVIQRGELTRLHDKDGDGVADYYEVASNDWGLTGNYHEFTFGLVQDSKKNTYIALGTASNGAGVREEVRGPWNDAGGLTHMDFLAGGEYGDWKVKKLKVSRMYSRVPYRGCVLRIPPDSMKAEVYATGFRTPNGLYMDANDQLWVSDNQGDWVGASKVHRVQEGGFHGHAASLLWGKNPPTETPAKLPIKELDKRRVKAAALLPQGDCGNSLTQILPYPETFGPSGSTKHQPLIVGDMNHSRIPLYLPDVVNGQHQGTTTHLLATNSIGMGNNRLLYSPDGKSLYLGKTHLSWPGREGIKRVTYNGKPYLQVESVKLTPDGFDFTFNTDVTAPQDLDSYKIESYRIAYHASYGSKKYELEAEPCAKITAKGRVLSVHLSQTPKENRVYDIILSEEITSKLSRISSNRFWYTAHEVY